ncbi:MAG: UPF0149 family protein [Pseudomonadales bacterium]
MSIEFDDTAALLCFDDIANLLVSESVNMITPSQLQGIICGQLASGARLSEDLLLKSLQDFLDLDKFSHETSKVGLCALYQQCLGQFEDVDMALDILLPDDDHQITQRVESLGVWVEGFLSGFGIQGKQTDKTISRDAKEMLSDFAQISQVESQDLEESDESENDFAQLVEYVRMGALFIFTEFNTAQQAAAPASEPKTLH